MIPLPRRDPARVVASLYRVSLERCEHDDEIARIGILPVWLCRSCGRVEPVAHTLSTW